ncbi:MAG: 50S ribosome-binding GTPase [Gemmataceae bacterium]|nr:50S ribosome-binding GTPase [Gemmataceae bacterium]
MSPIDDTIVALSSAAQPGGRAIVRLSGPQSLAISDSVFHATGSVAQGRSVTSGFLAIHGVPSPLPAERFSFPGPTSYTGQTVVELHLLSSLPLVERLIADLIASGARPAGPGEFTLRAFLSGQLDLPKAEAALGAIEAGDREELKSALRQLAGGVSRPLDGLRDDLLNLLADLEAGLDFADENLEFVAKPETLKRLADAMARVTLVQKQIAGRGVAGRVFRVAFAGPPNAGKSRLFNALSGSSAIVSSEAGTTRDYLVARISSRGQTLELIDTAGIRTAADSLEEDSQRLGKEVISTSDLILLCHDATHPESVDAPGVGAILKVATKCDLAPSPIGMLATSAETGFGLAALVSELAAKAAERSERGLAPSLSRCAGHVDTCLSALRKAHLGVLEDDPPEIVAADLRTALEELGRLTGTVHTDDLLDRVFSRFCIGK